MQTATGFSLFAPTYLSQGWSPLPLPPEKKTPPPRGYTGARGLLRPTPLTLKTVNSADEKSPPNGFALRYPHQDSRNLALRMPENVIGIDVDHRDEKTGADTIRTLEEGLGAPLPPTFKSNSRGGENEGGIFFFRVPEGVEQQWADAGKDVETVSAAYRYAVVQPSIHPRTKQPYLWYSPDGSLCEGIPAVSDLPELPAEWVEFLRKKPREQPDTKPEEWIGEEPAEITPYARAVRDNAAARLQALSAGGEGWDNNTFATACVLVRLANARWSGYSLDDAYQTLFENAPRDGGFGDSRVQEKWDSAVQTVNGEAMAYPKSAIAQDARAAIEKAKEQTLEVEGSTEEVSDLLGGLATFVAPPPEDVVKVTSDNLSDLIVAQRVSNRLSATVATSDSGGWLLWDGRKWRRVSKDSDLATAEFIREMQVIANEERALAYRIYVEAPQNGGADADWKAYYRRVAEADRLEQRSTIYAVRELSRPYLNRPDEFWDDQLKTSHLLNCWNGVVDLRTGELLPHDPAYGITRITNTRYIPGASHPDWDKCVSAISEDVVDWLQLKAGQSLTGEPATDSKMLILRGGGSNGKTTLLHGLFGSAGEYADNVPKQTLLEGAERRHPSELLEYRGLRDALVEEMPESGMTSEKVKELSSANTTMRARPMHDGDWKRWNATHCLWVTTNEPNLIMNKQDKGTWRRLALVEFKKTFEGKDIDPGLEKRMKFGPDGQHEAALAWRVEGAKRYYRDGLSSADVPETVTRDTEAWRMGENRAAQCLEEILEPADPDHIILAQDILLMAKEWYSQNNWHVPGAQKFWGQADLAEVMQRAEVERKPVRVAGKFMPSTARPVPETARVVTGVKLSSEGMLMFQRLGL